MTFDSIKDIVSFCNDSGGLVQIAITAGIALISFLKKPVLGLFQEYKGYNFQFSPYFTA